MRVPVATPANTIVAGSGWSMWPTEFTVAGTVWHVLHAMSACQAEPVVRCFWCAPTPRSVVALPVPAESNGGAFIGSLFDAGVPVWLPWQALHAWFVLTSRLPSMCLVASTNWVGAPTLTSS